MLCGGFSAGAGGAGGAAGAAGAGGAGCGALCFEADPEAIQTQEKWVYKGEGMGSYSQVSNMEMVGTGRGDFEKEKYTTVTSWRVRGCCVASACLLATLAIFLPIAWANNWWFGPTISNDDECMNMNPLEVGIEVRGRCCSRGLLVFCAHATPAPDKLVVHDKYYTQVKDVHVPHMVPVPIPPPARQVITHKVYVHTSAYDCNTGVGDYMHSWSRDQQRYCCYKHGLGCHTKVMVRPHYHTITQVKHVAVPVHVPIPAPPAQIINHVVNVPVHDAPQVIKVPVPGHPHVVPKYVHEKHYVPVPEASRPVYHSVPVPVPVKEPGQVIKVPSPLPPQTVVKNKVIYRTRHVKMLHVYDCNAGFNNWQHGWSSSKKSWCCSHRNMACPGDHSGDLTKTVVTHVTQHEGPSYYGHSYHGYTTHQYGAYGDDGSEVVHHYDSHDGRRLQEVHMGSEAPIEGSVEGGLIDGEGVAGDLGSGAGDSWVDGHWGHYDHSGAWVEVHSHQVAVPAPAPRPEVHEITRRHYRTVYRPIPQNHYVHVQMPQKPPLIHTVKVLTPPTTYDCSGVGGRPNPTWSEKHTRWCCYKYREFCPHAVVDKNYYHTVTKVEPVHVPVPEPMPAHAPIVHTIHQTYHVPSPPEYMHVHVPGPTVVKPVVVHDQVPVPVKEPPQVINVKKPYAVHVKGPDHYVKVPVPTPPHVVTHYHTQWNTVVDSSYDCQSGVSDWHHLWSHAKSRWCCSHNGGVGAGCPGHWVKHVHVVQTYDCQAGFSDWYHGWSDGKKSWCCDHEQRGCPGSWHGHWHHTVVVKHVVHGVGHGGYDCSAGASNWIQGWSGKKKDWCCQNGHNQYCVKFHCHAEHANVNAWSSEQRDFCCHNFQMGCPHTTLSPLGCDAQCVLNGESSTCKSRMEWTQKHVFGSQSNACNLAYSKVQVECDVCRACSVEAAGCGAQGPGKEAFDCSAALGNWCRAWSPAKKVWCCSQKGQGCQSPDTPPNCDAGAGKVWKKVFISGQWTWEAQMAGGTVSVAQSYACHEGLPNWSAGWSPAKKTWCCSHEKLGCPGFVYHGPGAGSFKHVVVTHHYVSGAAGAAGGAAHGGSWSSGGSYSSGGHVVVHHGIVH